MKYRVEITELADADLEAIYWFICADNPDAAIRFTRHLRDHCLKLATMPFRGPPSDEIWPGIRTLSSRGRVTVVYRVKDGVVLVLRLLYAGQQFPDEFQ